MSRLIRWLLVVTAMLASVSARAASNPLTVERGRSRPLVVVAPDASAPVALALQAALSQPETRAAFDERQVVVFSIVAGQGRREDRAIDPAATAAMLAALGLRANGPGSILLVGKDGGVKLRLGQLSVPEILAAIDSMPMRRQEMGRP